MKLGQKECNGKKCKVDTKVMQGNNNVWLTQMQCKDRMSSNKCMKLCMFSCSIPFMWY
jgi:hypothetical protein